MSKRERGGGMIRCYTNGTNGEGEGIGLCCVFERMNEKYETKKGNYVCFFKWKL